MGICGYGLCMAMCVTRPLFFSCDCRVGFVQIYLASAQQTCACKVQQQQQQNKQQNDVALVHATVQQTCKFNCSTLLLCFVGLADGLSTCEPIARVPTDRARARSADADTAAEDSCRALVVCERVGEGASELEGEGGVERAREREREREKESKEERKTVACMRTRC